VSATQTVTLAFRDPEVEQAYGDAVARAMRTPYRVLGVIALVVAIGSWFSDGQVQVTAANLALVHTTKLLFLYPVIAACAAVGYLPARTFRRAFQPAMAVLYGSLLGWNAVMGALLPEPGVIDVRVAVLGVVFLTMAGAVANMRFVHVAVLSVLANLAIAVVIAVRMPGPVPDALGFFQAAGVAVATFAARVMEQRDRKAFLAARLLDAERARSDRLLRNVLPASIAERLKDSDRRIADHFDDATVLFADIVGFTVLAERLSPAELVSALDAVFSDFDDLAERHGLEKIKTIGDAYMVVGGVPTAGGDHAIAVAEMALAMRACIDRHRIGGVALAIRIGIHTGPVVAGVIGKRKFLYDLWGDTVNTASRLESHGVAGEIQVSEVTRSRLADRFELESRGRIAIKGKGDVATWLLRGDKVPPS
jgi:class 3 adenylate cyclase